MMILSKDNLSYKKPAIGIRQTMRGFFIGENKMNMCLSISDAEKSALYYSASSRKTKPEFVPATINVFRETFGDFPFLGAGVAPGVVECKCNAWGAVCVEDRKGKRLGLRLNEFAPVTWRENLSEDA